MRPSESGIALSCCPDVFNACLARPEAKSSDSRIADYRGVLVRFWTPEDQKAILTKVSVNFAFRGLSERHRGNTVKLALPAPSIFIVFNLHRSFRAFPRLCGVAQTFN
jgi:hypothetical protein